jgi:translation initiation factor 1
MRQDDSELVYSTDTHLNSKIQKKSNAKKASLPNHVDQKDFTAVLRIEKSGRKGKVVSVIDGLPNLESYLKPLSQELKEKCGSGGTFILGEGKGSIEIQGDKREFLRILLEKKNIKVKG